RRPLADEHVGALAVPVRFALPPHVEVAGDVRAAVSGVDATPSREPSTSSRASPPGTERRQRVLRPISPYKSLSGLRGEKRPPRLLMVIDSRDGSVCAA